MYTTLLSVYFFISFCLIALILIQPGKGGMLGGAEGGAASLMFASQGSASPLTQLCRVFAALFLGICLLLGRLLPYAKAHKTPEEVVVTASAEPTATEALPTESEPHLTESAEMKTQEGDTEAEHSVSTGDAAQSNDPA